jgi:spermidine synthase
MMSDTPMEKRSNREVVFQARGDVLIAGLGIGMVLLPILAKPEVKSVTVVEKSQEIIQLVAPALYQQPGAEKLTIVYKDVFDWRPEEGTKYDTLYFDIWPTIVEDNLDEMDDLHRIFRRYRRKGSWMNSWMRETLKFQQQRRRRQRVF